MLRCGHHCAWSRTFKIHPLHTKANLIAVTDEIAKVFPSDFRIRADLAGFCTAVLELLQILLKAGTEVVGWNFKCSADLGTDADCVGVSEIDERKLCCDLGAETTRQRRGNGSHGIRDAQGN